MEVKGRAKYWKLEVCTSDALYIYLLLTLRRLQEIELLSRYTIASVQYML